MLIIAALTLLVYYIGLQAPQPTQQVSDAPVAPLKTGYYRVTRIADGDTFTVNMDGNLEIIRLIGVDTPETHRPNTPVQCFGESASTFTKKILQENGNQVRLEAEPLSTNRDRYDRLLRYAYLRDGRLLNQEIIEQGYGFAYTSFPFGKSSDFKASELRAKTQNLGLWGGCDTTETQTGIKQTVPTSN